jgi:uncharacterized membrane protein
MENQDQNNNKKWNSVGNGIFIGCMFVGLGIGMYYEKTSIGALVGMGIGFIASSIAKSKL